METKKNFSRINEEIFADVLGTVKAQEGKQANKQEAYVIADAEVIGLDEALKRNKNCMAVIVRAVEKHAGKRSCVSDVKLLDLLKDQLSECVGKRFYSLSILSKQDVIAAVSSYLSNTDPCYLCDVIITVDSIYSNGFIVSAE